VFFADSTFAFAQIAGVTAMHTAAQAITTRIDILLNVRRT